MNKRRRGEIAEGQAARFLEQAGYRVLDRNYRTRFGEIDLVVEKDRVLAFVEVKMRTGDFYGQPVEAVDPAKQRKIIQVAQHYLAEHSFPDHAIRFDVVTLLREDAEQQIIHIEDAFRVDANQDLFFDSAVAASPGRRQLEKFNLVLGDYQIVYRRLDPDPRKKNRNRPTCLFLHGFSTNGLLWRKIIPPIAKAGYCCIAPDQYGLGESSGPKGGDYSLSKQAEVLNKLVRKLGFQSLILIGHDTGGGIAQIYAGRWPEQVKALVLTNSVAFDAWPVSSIRLLQWSLKFGFGKILLHPKQGRKLAGSRFGFRAGLDRPEEKTPEMLERYIDPLLRNGFRREQYRQYLLAMNNRDTRNLETSLKEFQQPVMVAWAEGDPFLPQKIGKRLAGVFPHSTFVSLPKGSHFHIEEEPEQFAGVLLEFLKTL